MRRFTWAVALVASGAYAGAQAPASPNPASAEAYLSPPSLIERMVLAPRHTNVSLSDLSPDRKRFLVTRSSGMPSLESLAKPYVNLGGFRVDTLAQRNRNLTVRNAAGFAVYEVESGKWIEIPAPQGTRVAGGEWSPDGSQIAFVGLSNDSAHIYVADAATGRSRRVAGRPLLPTQVTSIIWTSDGARIVGVFRPANQGQAPRPEAVPSQPTLRLTTPQKESLRTYAALLETQVDQAMFRFYSTGQLGVVDVATGRVREIGKPAMIRSVDPAPDGKHFRVVTILEPFSYIVPASSFGEVEEVWDSEGKPLAEIRKRTIGPRSDDDPTDSADVPYGEDPAAGAWTEEEQRPQGGAATGQAPSSGKRSLSWRPDGAGLSFLQLEPAQRAEGGQAAPSGPRKDRVMLWEAPFGESNQKVIYESERGINSVSYSEDCQTLFLTETVSGQSVTYAVRLSDPGKRYELQKAATGPNAEPAGSLVTRRNANGRSVVVIGSGERVYFSGTQFGKDPEKEAPRPFVDATTIATGEKSRLWQSSAEKYETFSLFLNEDQNEGLIVRQSPTEPPNAFWTNFKGTERKLTDNQDPTPAVTRLERRFIRVKRVDGYEFWVKITLPELVIGQPRLPAFFWFYPREYTDQASYDRTRQRFNKNLFPNTGSTSKEYLVLQGYALVEPDCPIFGAQGRMNDRYVSDLRNNLAATIDALEAQGLIDRTRLAIGGHSYGAFSTANAMVHTPFFKAGIAGDGNYNRLLTPASFQSEQRQLWDARETYLTMSPLLYAEQMNGALLMYHGMDDQNVGTAPINSIRMFHALETLGKTASLYMYPYEDHGPAAKETILDLWARWVAWLDKYLKDSP